MCSLLQFTLFNISKIMTKSTYLKYRQLKEKQFYLLEALKLVMSKKIKYMSSKFGLTQKLRLSSILDL